MFDNQLCKSLKIRHRIFTLSLGGHFSLIIEGKAHQVAIPRAARLNDTLKMRRKEVLAAKIGNDAPFGTAVLPVVLHQFLFNGFVGPALTRISQIWDGPVGHPLSE